MINADNGPENSGIRTQWLRRLVEISGQPQVDIQLTCYAPDHSKYKPIERGFGVLENYWNGDPLTSVANAMGMAGGMTCKGVHPNAMLVEEIYQKGIKFDKRSMKPYENCLQRLVDLGKWFIRISSVTAGVMLLSIANKFWRSPLS